LGNDPNEAELIARAAWLAVEIERRIVATAQIARFNLGWDGLILLPPYAILPYSIRRRTYEDTQSSR